MFITYRNFKNFCENNFLLDLQSVPFNTIEYESVPSDCLTLFYDILNAVLDKHAPIVTKRVKRDNQPDWYNSDIIYAGNMRDKCNELGMWDDYKFWRNRTTSLIDNSKRNYYSNMVKNSKDSKTLWKCIHSLNPKVKCVPYELRRDEKIITDNKKLQILLTIFLHLV